MAPSIERSYGGPTESLIRYILAAETAGIELSVAAPECGDDDVQSFTARAGNATLRLFPSFGSGAFAISPALLRWVDGAAGSYDAVHVHGLFNTISSLAARSCIRRRIPVAIRPFGTLSRYTFLHRRTTLKKAYLALLERGNIARASAIHFTTDTERMNAEWHGIPFDGRAHIIPPSFSPAAPRSRVAGRDATRVSVVFLGRIEPVKNIEAVLDAWPLVLLGNPLARLTVAGAGSPGYVQSLKDRADRLKINETVAFTGFADDRVKDDLLDAASIFVLPSHHENFGIAAVEALAASLPVVISRHVQLAPFVEANRLGLISETDPRSLAGAILRAVGDRELHDRVRADAPRALAASFSPRGVGQLLLQMYQDAIRRGSEPADTRPG